MSLTTAPVSREKCCRICLTDSRKKTRFLPTVKKRNMGIGLSVCASIIHAHGGTIKARNRPEGGADIRFVLDLEEKEHDQQ